MTTIRRFCCNDLLQCASIHLNHFVTTFDTGFYMSRLAVWTEYCLVAEDPRKQITGYIMGKPDKNDEYWYGIIKAVTFSSETLQITMNLMKQLEDIFDQIAAAYFVEINVKASFSPAVKMVEKSGYVVYKRLKGYYISNEDALNYRKALSRDVEKKSLIPPRDKSSYAPDELYTVNDEHEDRYW